jgi:hypothetical protein
MIECPEANHDNVVAAAADLESCPSVQVDDEFSSMNLCPFLINKPPVSGHILVSREVTDSSQDSCLNIQGSTDTYQQWVVAGLSDLSTIQ